MDELFFAEMDVETGNQLNEPRMVDLEPESIDNKLLERLESPLGFADRIAQKYKVSLHQKITAHYLLCFRGSSEELRTYVEEANRYIDAHEECVGKY